MHPCPHQFVLITSDGHTSPTVVSGPGYNLDEFLFPLENVFPTGMGVTARFSSFNLGCDLTIGPDRLTLQGDARLILSNPSMPNPVAIQYKTAWDIGYLSRRHLTVTMVNHGCFCLVENNPRISLERTWDLLRAIALNILDDPASVLDHVNGKLIAEGLEIAAKDMDIS